MLERVISGGQTGADQGGWRAARAYGIATGGAMPLGFLTEDGPRPEFAERFGAVELPTDSYKERTRANVRDTEATLWLGDDHSPGGRTTLDACRVMVRPYLIARAGVTKPGQVRDWIVAQGIRTLNVAGNRESSSRGSASGSSGSLGRSSAGSGIGRAGECPLPRPSLAPDTAARARTRPGWFTVKRAAATRLVHGETRRLVHGEPAATPIFSEIMVHGEPAARGRRVSP